MARQNNIYLYARVKRQPEIVRNIETREPSSALSYVQVVRGVRDAHDKLKFIKYDTPLIISFDPKTIREMETWRENDMVYIKGTLSSKLIPKASYCPYCKDENGVNTKNKVDGQITYVTPIFAKKMEHCSTKEEAVHKLLENREISNQAIVVGKLCSNPKYFKLKNGRIITQYQIVTDRKFHIKSDDPTIRKDFPWVKVYGEQAIEDRLRLQKGSDIIIDGFVQARIVHRKTKCPHCGKVYPWEDKAMEIIPYDTEYLDNYKTDEQLEAEEKKSAEELRQLLYNNVIKDDITEDIASEDTQNLA